MCVSVYLSVLVFVFVCLVCVVCLCDLCICVSVSACLCTGYGDLYPTTPFGRLMGVCCMLIGILALALPIGVMGSSFNRNYAQFHGRNDALNSSENASEVSSVASNVTEGMVYELDNEIVMVEEDEDVRDETLFVEEEKGMDSGGGNGVAMTAVGVSVTSAGGTDNPQEGGASDQQDADTAGHTGVTVTATVTTTETDRDRERERGQRGVQR
jgi:hypothetical protein